MFKIYDGRNEFYQWDLDRKVIVNDDTITKVHFSNQSTSNALIRPVYEYNGLNVADVPNSLLQDSWRIIAYGFDTNYTKYEDRFDVIARAKPDDYVYTDEEVYTWQELDKRITEIEENGVSDEMIEQAISDYLAENPIETDVDLTGYATEKYVDEAVGAIEIPSLEGYATEEFVTQKIAEAELGGSTGAEVDLSNYYTKSETDKAIETAIGAVEVPSVEGLASEKYVDDAIGAIVFPVVPDAVSAFTNDAGYQTESQVNALIEAYVGVIENGTY